MLRINDRVFAKTMAFLTGKGRSTKQSQSTAAETLLLETNPSLVCPTTATKNGLRNFCSRENMTHSGTNPSNSATSKRIGILCRVILGIFFGILSFFALVYVASAPPMHWFYDPAVGKAAAGSVYLPGGGFSGFWFHLGYIHAFGENHDLKEYDYYCFSAGCLSILSVFLNRSLEEVYDSALASQNAWKSGNRSRFEIVDYFMEELIEFENGEAYDCPGYSSSNSNNESRIWNENCSNSRALAVQTNTTCRRGAAALDDFLPRLKIFVTTPSTKDGYQVLVPTNREELKEYILRTTWVPYLTGSGFRMPAPNSNNKNEMLYLDGAFSRNLHPKCQTEWTLPLMWETLVHTFSPGLSREQVQSLWERGRNYEYPIPESTRYNVASNWNATIVQQ